jgi:hypothetical protein
VARGSRCHVGNLASLLTSWPDDKNEASEVKSDGRRQGSLSGGWSIEAVCKEVVLVGYSVVSSSSAINLTMRPLYLLLQTKFQNDVSFNLAGS